MVFKEKAYMNMLHPLSMETEFFWYQISIWLTSLTNNLREAWCWNIIKVSYTNVVTNQLWINIAKRRTTYIDQS